MGLFTWRAVFNMAPFSSKKHYFDSLEEPVWNLVLLLRREPIFFSAKTALFSHGEPFWSKKSSKWLSMVVTKMGLNTELSYGPPNDLFEI